jgi:hypothetical protein
MSDGFSSFYARSAAVGGCVSAVAATRTKNFGSKSGSAWPTVAFYRERSLHVEAGLRSSVHRV